MINLEFITSNFSPIIVITSSVIGEILNEKYTSKTDSIAAKVMLVMFFTVTPFLNKKVGVLGRTSPFIPIYSK